MAFCSTFRTVAILLDNFRLYQEVIEGLVLAGLFDEYSYLLEVSFSSNISNTMLLID